MPTAKCKNCGKEIHWRNQRGNRLSDYTCECGGKFGRETVPNRGPSKTKGTTYGKCAVCGRKKMIGHGGIIIDETTRYETRDYEKHEDVIITVDAGGVVCWRCKCLKIGG